MFRNIFNNIPDVTKNLLIVNVLFFLATFALESQNISLRVLFSMHYPGSDLFEPYQVITHMFMHADFGHLLFNMIGLIVFGSMLERSWGKKRYFIFYISTAIGATLLHTFVQGVEIHALTGEWLPQITISELQEIANGQIQYMYSSIVPNANQAAGYYIVGSLGASGAVYGLLMGAALIFPNTEMMLLFPPMPVKLKWIALALGLLALYQGYQNSPDDSVAHFAHLGGMIVGFIFIQVWKKDRQKFY